MTLTRKTLADAIDAYDAEIETLQSGKRETYAEYRQQLADAGMGKDAVKAEVDATKAAIKRRQSIAKKGNEVIDAKDALTDEIFAEITTGTRNANARVARGARAASDDPAEREARRKMRLSESMLDNIALSADMLRDGLITAEQHAENVAISEGVARKLGAGVINPETGEIIEDNEPASSEAQVRADRSEWPDRQNEPDHSPDAGKMVNEPATAPPTVGGPVEGVAPPASSATNFPVTVEGSSSTGGTDVGGDGEAHSQVDALQGDDRAPSFAGVEGDANRLNSPADKSGEGDAPSPAPGDGEPTNVVALPVRKPSDRPLSTSGLERPYGCLHVDACPKTWRDTEPCSMCRVAIAVEAGGTAVRHQGSIGQ